MRLLEAAKLEKYPAGGAKIPVNMLYVFTGAVVNGITKAEITREELLGFIKCFSSQLPADINIAKGDFHFWGVHITLIN